MNKKCFIIFTGNEGSSYLTTELSKYNQFYHLGYEKYDPYQYLKHNNISDKDLFNHFRNDIISDYSMNFNGKIPYCKCRLDRYSEYGDSISVLKEINPSHVILLYRAEFEHLIHKGYLIENEKHLGNHLNLGQFDKDRNNNFLKYAGSIKIKRHKFKNAILNNLNYLDKKKKLLKQLKSFSPNVLVLEYNELIKMDFKSGMESFFDCQLTHLSESEWNNTPKPFITLRDFKWFDLFDEESKEFLKKKEKEYNKQLETILPIQ